ncbi:sensor histidine kinase [Paenibacillus cremeus]|uniref:histidine kinase n=1 Tax=Paenibacillus cremeus TaxID=2163881 RepID=A0A559JSR2_9BACL|nr:HAMP domain-containing sensor histidine kinase [Paenibacillus cremeus]TVY02924.1 HAMP domain-containing histidine kinase [Paenibacillus cremeus]
MSIRLKLLLSYAAMLVVPFLLILLSAVLLGVVYRGDVQNIRDLYWNKASQFNDHRDERLVKEMRRTADKNPSLFADPKYLDDLTQELANSGSGLVVRKDDKLSYASPLFKDQDLLNLLPPFEREGYRDQEQDLKLGSQLYTIWQFDFLYEDHHPGSVLILEKANPIVGFARKFFPILFLSVLVILVLTHTVLTYVVSRSIIGPLQLLKRAAHRIKAGDLDFRVQVSGKDEIGQLGIAFEEMRGQLQESIRLQLQYEENRKELISNISHDLKTPLTAIRGYVDGIHDGIADTPDKMIKYVRTISSKTEEMEHLIDELFLYSKLDLKQLPFHFVLVPIHAFVHDWAEELQLEREKKGYAFEADIQIQKSTQVSIDRDKLKRVFSNIMDNCVKYMDKRDKQVCLRAYDTASDVVIEISDNGQGISAEAIAHIFDRFYRAEQSRNTQTGGSGLGLAIAKQIVEGHSGTIEARSVLGEGTQIIIKLPVKTL